MNVSEQSKQFCKRYDAEIRQGNKQYYRRNTTVYDLYKQDSLDARCDVVPSVEITMPIDCFNSFLNTEQRLVQLMNSSAMVNYHPGDVLWEEYIRESKIREQHPSVKIAYEKYVNLLNLVSSNYG